MIISTRFIPKFNKTHFSYKANSIWSKWWTVFQRIGYYFCDSFLWYVAVIANQSSCPLPLQSHHTICNRLAYEQWIPDKRENWEDLNVRYLSLLDRKRLKTHCALHFTVPEHSFKTYNLSLLTLPSRFKPYWKFNLINFKSRLPKNPLIALHLIWQQVNKTWYSQTQTAIVPAA